MKFSITLITLFTAVAVAMPSPAGGAIVMKRTCGTLTGDALTACQDACKALCTVGTAGLAKTACTAACDAPPLRVRDTKAVQASPEEINGRDVETSICDGACDVACNSTVLALEQTKCLAACKAKCT